MAALANDYTRRPIHSDTIYEIYKMDTLAMRPSVWTSTGTGGPDEAATHILKCRCLCELCCAFLRYAGQEVTPESCFPMFWEGDTVVQRIVIAHAFDEVLISAFVAVRPLETQHGAVRRLLRKSEPLPIRCDGAQVLQVSWVASDKSQPSCLRVSKALSAGSVAFC